jgi:glutamyl-tRNA synthetase
VRSTQLSTIKKEIRCRFAPSPTGALHVGGARTALFNYLFSRSQAGKHILRIEDTDKERSTPEALEAIIQGLNWLQIPYDEGPFFQSERTDLYLRYAKKLLNLGHAYPCSCTTERLNEVRTQLQSEGKKPQYDRLHRPIDLKAQPNKLPSSSDKEPFVIRLRIPDQGNVGFEDAIIGLVQTPINEIDDFVLIRSDGSPTYNFTVVVDDIEMAITHVIRGMDHISNTPKQLVIYHALEKEPPIFAHVPMILGPDKKKLSKRHGATSVFEYKKEGYLPDAFVNALARLGWSHGDQEIFSRNELEKYFSLNNVGKSAAVFDTEKLQWINAEHIKLTTPAKLAPYVIEILVEQGIPAEHMSNNKAFLKLIETLQPRTKLLTELANQCKWYFHDDRSIEFVEHDKNKHLVEEIKAALTSLIEKLEHISSFNEAEIEECFHTTLKEFDIKLVKLAQPVRVAITGTAISPPIYTVLETLGKEKSIIRLRRALEVIGDS